MMNDVRAGKINCILVKDFSRFGRNYIETGNYLEKILPFMKVRFVSVCDNYDSYALGAKNQELSMNIKNLVNDAYAKTFLQRNGQQNVLHRRTVSMWDLQLHTDIVWKR